MQIIGDGYYKARNENGQSCQMRLEVGWGREDVTIRVLENRSYLDDKGGTRAENAIVFSPDEAKRLAEEIMVWLDKIS